jgi:hypothetical protein
MGEDASRMSTTNRRKIELVRVSPCTDLSLRAFRDGQGRAASSYGAGKIHQRARRRSRSGEASSMMVKRGAVDV